MIHGPPKTPHRRGFTLIELLVVMAVIIVLTSIVVAIVPGALSQDRTTDGAGLIRQWLMTAKARAARDTLPRGLRLVVDVDSNNPVKGTNVNWVTEIQLIEAPPILLGSSAPNAPTGAGTGTASQPTSPQPMVTISQTQCVLVNSPTTVTVLTQIQSDLSNGRYPVLWLPTLNSWVQPDQGFAAHVTACNSTANPLTWQLTLDQYPSWQLGAATFYGTLDFGVYGAARPLLGEPVLQLPMNTCIDLRSSSPGVLATNTSDYDILFAPDGRVIDAQSNAGGAGQINLWVRDYTKPGGSGGNFQAGGEQQFVAIKTKSGSLGAFPIAWTGNAFQFATQGATGP